MGKERECKSDATQAQFEQTNWSVVLPAANQHAPGAAKALEQLCKIYWPPLYAFLRRQGHSPENAKDLTQGFFAHLLAGDKLINVTPAKGTFRSFLLRCLSNFVQNERNKQHAEKRGWGVIDLGINIHEVEPGLGLDFSDHQDPSRIFERKWAAVLIQQVLLQLGKVYEAAGKQELFETLQPFLNGQAERGDYAAAATRLNLAEGAVRVAATRLREQFGVKLRAEVGRTVSSPSQIDDEIRHLLKILGAN